MQNLHGLSVIITAQKSLKEVKQLVSAYERRNEILRLLRLRKFDKVENLAFEFSVSERTIRHDIFLLSLTENIQTKQGRYGGVYYLGKDNGSAKEKIELLHKLEKYCTIDEQPILRKILKDYGA